MTELVFSGQIASPGLALGRLHLRKKTQARQRSAGDAAAEEAALLAAIDQAARQLESLAEQSDSAGAEILEFQGALLDDDDLIDPIVRALRGGEAAHDAWKRTLDVEIADYAKGADEIFEARAADLRDLRDRVLGILSGEEETEIALPEGAILATENLSPSGFLSLDAKRCLGLVLREGSAHGHVAMLARARGLPLLIGLGADYEQLIDESQVVLDAEAGKLVLDPSETSWARARARFEQRGSEAEELRAYLEKPAVTSEGEAVAVMINVDSPALLSDIDPAHCDGIGLTRTEFLFHEGSLPDEERQYGIYATILRWAAGRTVTIRTLDAGGDKPIPGLTPEGESNPFLGLRGLRLSLAYPEVFKVQLRALARAAALGPLKVMAPMVTLPSEFDRFVALFDAALTELEGEGIQAARPQLGMMIEVPAAALTTAAFNADFFSIGSNDLTQYVTASARDCPAVGDLLDPGNPAVLELIERVVNAGLRKGVEVSLCGDMAGEPDLLPLLLAAGLRQVSVSPARLAVTKAAVAAYPGGAITGLGGTS